VPWAAIFCPFGANGGDAADDIPAPSTSLRAGLQNGDGPARWPFDFAQGELR